MKKGFTLIELLVVIAIIAVLAVIVLLGVNPSEQLRRSRDTSRLSAVIQLGRAVQAFYTAQGAKFPTVGTTWMDSLINSRDLKKKPTNANYDTAPTTPCTYASYADGGSGGGTVAGYCYNATTTDAIIYVRAESVLYAKKCTTAGTVPWLLFSTYDGKGGVVCSSSEPVVGVGGQTFVP